ncbi:serine/threonine-protein phosphatase 6 regulatory ankyrin repeat subunit B-like isoform X7 [Scylla paramamosain]
MSGSLVSVAAINGHHRLLRCLLQAGLSIEGGGTTDTTPLMEAAEKGHTQTVKALLTLGANPLATDSGGRTALHYAAARGQQQCVAALTPVTPPTPAHLEALTPVHAASYCGHVEVLEQLAGAGWPLTARDSDGNTPLHLAAAGGSVTCQEWLEQRGGDPRVLNKAGHTPRDTELLTAVAEGDEARVRSSLARGAHSEITVPSVAGMSGSLVSVAAINGHHRLLRCLLQAGLSIEGGGTTDRTPLMEAAGNGHTQTVKALLTLGANPLATDSGGRTALHYAAARGQQQCVAALTPVTPPTPAHLEALTPVHAASYCGHVEVLEQLAGAGWPLTTRDSDGDTPLHLAAAGGSVTCQEWLEQRGGDPRVLNKAGHTPRDKELLTAVAEGDEARVRSSLARGAHSEITLLTVDGMLRSLVSVAAINGHHHLLRCLLQAGLSIEGGGTTDRTPLMEAAEKGHTQTVKALLTLGANPLATDNGGRMALHYAAARGQQQCVAALTPVTPPTPAHLEALTPVHTASYRGHVEVLEQLAGAGWPLTARDSDGKTPLHLAAEGGSVTCLRWLVNRGGDTRVQNKSGHTPLDTAVQFGRHEVETWLVKNSGAVVRNEDQRVEEVRIWRRRHENNHITVLFYMMEGNKAAMSLIPEDYDGHVLNREGLTPLHVAALRGASSRVVEALLRRGVSPHVITPDNMTPADLARQEGHDPVIKGLQCHRCEQSAAPPESLYQELLSTISLGDDVQAVSSLLCQGASIEPRGGRSPLRLAVTTDRARTVSLLLASGASLSATLLQEAWQSPNVTHMVLASLTSAYCCRLRVEQRRLVEVSRALVEGISNLLEDIEGSTPWLAAWRSGEDTDHATLSDLLAKAAAANCPVTAAFLQSAGAWPFFSQASGGSALHAALDAGHQTMAEALIRDLGGCPYVPDTHGRLPVHMMSDEERQRLEQRLFEEEQEKLKDLELLQKADREKAAARTALDVQKVLFDTHKNGEDKNVSAGDGRAALLLAARKGLLQLTHLLLREGRRPVDEVVDDTCGTTALHQAASHGQDGCVALLLSAGANTQQRDSYGQTPRLLAAMFGHTSTADLLAQQDVQDVPCRAGTTAKQVTRGFEAYLQLYEKHAHDPLTPFDRHNPDGVTRKLMKCIRVGKLQQEAQRVAVDLSEGEALQIHEAVMAELKVIMDNVSAADPTYRGDLRLAGSSRDGSKLYAPDEFDVNIVIHGDDAGVNVSERRKEEALLKGRLQISVKTDNPNLKGNSFMANLYKKVHRCLAGHTLQDERLSLVPPGLTSTQVGVALALAWQGREYPLLLVGVDLVPVLEVPWPEQIPRPFLTPGDTTTMQLSNAADGSWRCSFALTEAKVLGTLSPAERQLQLMGKLLLSRLKAERWMPRHKKSFCTWFATREWNIPVPSGFCFKNALLRWLEYRRRGERHHAKQLAAGREGDPARWLVQVFRLMCADPEESRERLTTQNSSAYFGGDCEGRKPGDGAPVIVQCLEEDLEKLWPGSSGPPRPQPRQPGGGEHTGGAASLDAEDATPR